MATVAEKSADLAVPDWAPSQAVDEKVDRYLAARLKAVGADYRSVAITTFLLASGIGLVLWLGAGVIADHWLVPGGLGRTIRMAWLAVALAAVFAALIKWVVPLLRYRVNLVYAARSIERANPELRNDVVNTVLVRARPERIPAVVVTSLEHRTAKRLSKLPADLVTDRGPALRLAVALAILVGLACLYAVLSPKSLATSLARLAAPWSRIAPPTRVRIAEPELGWRLPAGEGAGGDSFHPIPVKDGRATIIRNRQLVVRSRIQGLTAGEAPTVEAAGLAEDGTIERAAGWRSPMEPAAARAADGGFEATLPGGGHGLSNDLVVSVAAGDARSETVRVVVVDAPSLLVKQLKLVPPAYTRREPEILEWQGDVSGLEGTRVTLLAESKGPLDTAAIDFGCDGQGLTKLRIDPRDLARASGSFDLRLSADRSGPWERNYRLVFRPRGVAEDDGRELGIEHRINVVADVMPEVRVVEPGKPVVKVPPDKPVAIGVEAVDPDFALRSVAIELEIERKGERMPRPSQPVLEREFAGPFRGRAVFKPASVGGQAGDRLLYRAVAIDSKSPSPNAARTEWFTLDLDAGAPPRPVPQDGRQGKERSEGGRGPGNSADGTAESGTAENGNAGGGSEQSNGGQNGGKQNGGKQGPSGEGASGEGESQGASEQSRPGNQSRPGKGGGAGSGPPEKGSQGERSQGAGGSTEGSSQQTQQASGSGGDPDSNDPSRAGESGGRDSGGTEKAGSQGDGSQGDGEGRQQQGGGQGHGDQSNGPQQDAGNLDGSHGSSGREQHDGRGNASAGKGTGKGTGQERQPPRQPSQTGGGERSQGEASEAERPVASDGTNDGEAIERILEDRAKDGSQDGSGRGEKGSGAEKTGREKTEQGEGNRDASRREGVDGAGGGQKEAGQKDKPDGEEQGSGGQGEAKQDRGQQPGGSGQDGGSSGRTASGRDDGMRKDGSKKPGAGESGSGEPANDGGEPASQPGGDRGDAKQKGDKGQGKAGGDRDGSNREAGRQPGEGNPSQDAGSQKSGDGKSGDGKSGDGKSGDSDVGRPGEDLANDDPPSDRKPAEQAGTGGRAGRGFGGWDAGNDGNRPEGQAASKEADWGEENLSHARNAVDLAVEHLKRSLDEGRGDVLDSLGWTRQEAQAFLDRWTRMAQTAKEGGPRKQRDFDRAVRSLGLTPSGVRRTRETAEESRGNQAEGRRSQPPPEYREQFRAFSQGIRSDGG